MSREQMPHDAAMVIMEEVGVRIHNTKARQILADNGIQIQGDTAYFTKGWVT
ncbi:Trimethylamine methyltransferase (MTTB) [Eubacterium barkeri]|uniref:Trimethylamine methyltransferase (MTTB) n=1 Tax=Eubacterium barkeri TaxID=1528 RepID=A0A1H3APR4_EUBBA|nr:Trimethylamine methyltransferase (MTTB) [Eubacterium barkeri]